MATASTAASRTNWIDRSLRVFADVRDGEGVGALLMFANVFVLLVTYYILKTVREPLILTLGGAELKSYAAAAQALVLMVYVPLYSWLAASLPRRALVITVVLFFFGCLEVFFAMGQARVPFVGFAFYVWVGIFSLTAIAQFWSYANDIYRREEGERLFSLIAIGSTAGAPLGAFIAGSLFAGGVSPYVLMQLAAVLLLLHLFLYRVVEQQRAPAAARQGQRAVNRAEGFRLVFRSRYLWLMALLLICLNLVNTTGEYILGSMVVDAADASAAAAGGGFDKSAFIGSFYGRYFFWVNVAAVVIQAFIVSRLVKYGGIAAALLALPIVALGTYGMLATGVTLAITRWGKTLENATDYSAMNTAKQMLWLPTTPEQKYQGKQAIDTFFVRAGDLLSAGVVFVGTEWLALTARGFAAGMLIAVAAWLALSVLLLREYRRLSITHEREKAA